MRLSQCFPLGSRVFPQTLSPCLSPVVKIRHRVSFTLSFFVYVSALLVFRHLLWQTRQWAHCLWLSRRCTDCPLVPPPVLRSLSRRAAGRRNGVSTQLKEESDSVRFSSDSLSLYFLLRSPLPPSAASSLSLWPPQSTSRPPPTRCRKNAQATGSTTAPPSGGPHAPACRAAVAKSAATLSGAASPVQTVVSTMSSASSRSRVAAGNRAAQIIPTARATPPGRRHRPSGRSCRIRDRSRRPSNSRPITWCL